MNLSIKEFFQEVLEFARTTGDRIGRQLLQDFGQVAFTEKKDGSLVTQADQWSDAEIRQAIQQRFPDHGVLSEETVHIFPPNDWSWIIDPVDGTTNFARGIPLWGLSLGLLYKGIPVFGYVYFPPINQVFHGFYWQADGEEIIGAFLNNRPIQPSPDDLTKNHFFNLCTRSVQFAPHIPAKVRILGLGIYNFLTVAMGSTLGGVEATPKIWDIVAAWVIVKAAGAVWYDLQGNTELFPLEVGKNYASISYPTLLVSRSELLTTFLPLVEDLGKNSHTGFEKGGRKLPR